MQVSNWQVFFNWHNDGECSNAASVFYQVNLNII